MAKPRIFISSTYYDLKSIRSELEVFISGMGYEPVLNEKGHISYGSKERLEEYCYKEIRLCDILISVIGGRYGNKSSHNDEKISQHELKTALDLGRQVFIFIDRAVKTEHRFYQANKGKSDIVYTAVDNKKVYEILDYIDGLPLNNATFGFDTGQEIIHYLKEQFSGLFKNLLIEDSKKNEVVLMRDLKENIGTLNQIVSALSKDYLQRQDKVSEILVLQHPAFARLKNILKISHRVIFLNISDLNALVGAYGYRKTENEPWGDSDEIEFFRKSSEQILEKLVVKTLIFDNDQLKIFDPVEWKEDFIILTKIVSKSKDIIKDDEPPF